MEIFYYAIVIILFLLAISDLVVGVANDAVNFLNGAVGSRVAPFKVIIFVAAIGVLVGATFSSGMMEIARKGIFNPQQFVFAEIMVIFLAVMLTDVILLDTFNTFGLPTSTTVSLIFELLGAAVAISVIKITQAGQTISELGNYINSSKVLAIISGILVSVFIAFTVGSLIMYLSRLLFTYNYKKTLKYYGGLFGGMAITGITYFILIKGAKGSAFITEDTYKFITNNTLNIILISFVGWTILLQLLQWLFKLNILKVIVLVGTFALAMAFAGNDLVNFIGVPLAGFESFKAWMASGEPNPGLFGMDILNSPVKTPVFFLLIAGLVMVLTLIFNRKARTVLETSIDLSRQAEGDERFGSSFLSRTIVRSSYQFGKSISGVAPRGIKKFFRRRLDQSYLKSEEAMKQPAVSFDLVRAAVNLMVSSSLIALGTSLKLPLSTTYVTFMVAMGSSFADKAWGRESAVYRITGVLSVIGGWFITALAAFTISLIIATIIYFGGIAAIIGLILLALFFVYRTHIIHLRKEKDKKIAASIEALDEIKDDSVVNKCNISIISTVATASSVYESILDGLTSENLKTLKKAQKRIDALNKETKQMKNNMMLTLKKLQKDSVETGHYYVQILDYLREIAHCINFISTPAFDHINNNHKGLLPVQSEELQELNSFVKSVFSEAQIIIKDRKYSHLDIVFDLQQKILSSIEKARKAQVKRLKLEQVGTKNTLLYLNILQETKNLILYTVNLLKSHRDFLQYEEAKEKKK